MVEVNYVPSRQRPRDKSGLRWKNTLTMEKLKAEAQVVRAMKALKKLHTMETVTEEEWEEDRKKKERERYKRKREAMTEEEREREREYANKRKRDWRKKKNGGREVIRGWTQCNN